MKPQLPALQKLVSLPQMSLRFYNSLTQQVEPFTSQDGKTVRMYSCGPTVYNYAHIGNLRTFTFNDILRRWLRVRGYVLNDVMNITDVDDKIIRNAVAKGMTLEEYTRIYERAFLEDITAMRLTPPWKLVRATEHIPEMVEAIETLARKGYTYDSEGSTYFRIANFPEYGKLSHNDFSGIRVGARVDVDEYDKADARDFVLWKARKDDEPFWDTPLGKGRPGWHIECSAMAMKYLGATLDIHVGGVDLKFPHHENEIAQSEGVTGKLFSRFWLHSEHLLMDWSKMSKSAGNMYTLRDLVEMGHAPETLRYMLASVPYGKKLNFTFDGLTGAAQSIERVRNYALRLKTDRYPEGVNEALAQRAVVALAQFDAAMDNDLNTAEALGAVFEYIRETNTAMDSGGFLAGNVAGAQALLERFDAVFDVIAVARGAGSVTDEDVEKLVAERTQAKRQKDFARADGIRQQLVDLGIVIEDTKDGVRWKRK